MLFIIALLACAAASAETLPAIQGGDGYGAVDGSMDAPEVGQWCETAVAALGIDEAALNNLRTDIAIKATEMDFNGYSSMTYDDKASVVLSLIEFSCSENYFDFYGEGEDAASGTLVPVFSAIDGEYAVFAQNDGKWSCVSMFAVNGEAGGGDDNFTIDLSGIVSGSEPVIVACYIDSEGDWRAVGLNQVYINQAIANVF